jgi:hypothetical protein
MKPATVPIQKQSRALRTILKNVIAREKQHNAAGKNLRRLRIIHSMRAGHVRGGHSFH